MKNSLWGRLSLLVVLILVSLTSAHATNTHKDANLEQRLDDLIEVGFYPPDKERFSLILGELNDNTPIDTYIRAMSYRIFELSMREQNFPAAYELLARLQARVLPLASEEGQLELLVTEAHLLLLDNQLQQALALLPRMQELLQKSSNPRLTFFTRYSLAWVLQQNSQYEEALAHLLRAYEIVRQESGREAAARLIFVNLHIARLQTDLRNDEVALQLVKETIQLAKSERLYSRLPDLYLVQGFIHGRGAPNEKALQSFYLAIDWAERVEDNRVRLVGRNNAGAILLLTERYEEAQQILLEGVALSEKLNRSQDADVMRYNLGYIRVRLGEYESGLHLMEEATTRFRTYARAAEIADWLEYLADAYALSGEYQKQAATLIEQRDLREEIFRTERDRALSELRLQFEAEEQRREIELLQQRSELQEEQLANQRLWEGIVTLLVIMVGLILLLAYIASRKKNTELSETNKELHDKSIRDPLTGLLNRRSLQQAMSARERFPGEKDALFLIDIDFFKKINDEQGHAAGDAVLSTLASRLRQVCRETDLVVRWGGEEFLVVLRHTHVEMLTNFSNRLLQVIADEPITVGEHSIQVSATAGFVSLPLAGNLEAEISWERALQIADLLLYYGKSHGRNQINGISAVRGPMTAEIEQALFADINKAIEKHWVTFIQVKGPVNKA